MRKKTNPKKIDESPKTGKPKKTDKPKKTGKPKKVNAKRVNKTQKVYLEKYRMLILSIVAFLVLFITVLALNYYQSLKISRSADEIAIATRQGDLIQQITKSLIDIDLFSERMQNQQGNIEAAVLKEQVFKQYDQLNQATQTFNQSLNAFASGGNTTNANGKTIPIEALDASELPTAKNNIDTAQAIWKPFLGLINNFRQSYASDNIEISTIKFAADYARNYNTELLADMNDLSIALQERANKQTNLIQLIQIIGIITALMLFAFIALRVLTSLFRSDRELEEARKETTDILNTVQEGLFLITSDLIISDQQSKKIGQILPVKNIAHKPFDEVISSFISEKDLINTKRFIKQLFNKQTKESLINDLNPLQCLSFTVEEKNATFTERYLRFQFYRVYENKKISKVLVSITDITEATQLRQQLDSEREQNIAFTEMLMKVLLIKPQLLNSFIRNTTNVTTKINDILKESDKSQVTLRGKVDKIFREIHSFKGEASVLEFDNLVAIAEETENKLDTLRKKTTLTGNDFIAIALSLDSIIDTNNNLINIQSRLADFSKPTETVADTAAYAIGLTEHIEDNAAFSEQLAKFSQDIAERHHKAVQLNVTGFSDNHLPSHIFDTVKDISIQAIRNAVVHGIELPNIRTQHDKQEIGNIKLRLTKQARCELIIEDDGAGIDFDALREKLKHHPKFAHTDVSTLTKLQLCKALFLSDISTTAESNEDAGRGEGMSIMLDRIRSLNGKVSLASNTGEFTRIAIRFNL